MLILSRKIDQIVDIGNDITVTVIDIRGDKVRLGIDAPKELRVDRREVTEKRNQETTPCRESRFLYLEKVSNQF